ncbi:hypothetical protein EV182_000944 [Spiromyces aspiralis]|uniref:Uncharacterized protein n=1 Tax=Spiromyces aspiralis TaxID=68401 RepID=A0ACC1HGK9_9FUNG|nr:hypothetical protein EV182_000944 [Spiromyces aspiralis]
MKLSILFAIATLVAGAFAAPLVARGYIDDLVAAQNYLVNAKADLDQAYLQAAQNANSVGPDTPEGKKILADAKATYDASIQKVAAKYQEMVSAAQSNAIGKREDHYPGWSAEQVLKQKKEALDKQYDADIAAAASLGIGTAAYNERIVQIQLQYINDLNAITLEFQQATANAQSGN